jgi:hypothetical protein
MEMEMVMLCDNDTDHLILPIDALKTLPQMAHCVLHFHNKQAAV